VREPVAAANRVVSNVLKISRSLKPGPPLTWSWPWLALMMSLPPSALMMSSPSEPVSVSAPAVPVTTSPAI
jgi:hypothetical protein